MTSVADIDLGDVDAMTSGVNPQDAVREAEQAEAVLANRTDRLTKRANTLQAVIHENANPSPWFMAALIIGVLLGMWLVYVSFLKPDMSGEWYDQDGRQWIIQHGLFSDTLCVRVAAGRKVTCKLAGNTFKCLGKLGVWNYGNVVLFLRGGHLTRVIQ